MLKSIRPPPTYPIICNSNTSPRQISNRLNPSPLTLHARLALFSEYEREGILWKFISFPDNQDVLDLIDRKHTGILALLDEQCIVPKSDDQKFTRYLYAKCDEHARFNASSAQRVDYKFSIEHYAGPVEYSTENWLEKNKDQLPASSAELLKGAKFDLLAHIQVCKFTYMPTVFRRMQSIDWHVCSSYYAHAPFPLFRPRLRPAPTIAEIHPLRGPRGARVRRDQVRRISILGAAVATPVSHRHDRAALHSMPQAERHVGPR